MKTQEILSIIALSLLGLCVLSGLVKMTMKKESHKKPYEQGCTASVFIAVVLLGISQLLDENVDGYTPKEACEKQWVGPGYPCQSNKDCASVCGGTSCTPTHDKEHPNLKCCSC